MLIRSNWRSPGLHDRRTRLLAHPYVLPLVIVLAIQQRVAASGWLDSGLTQYNNNPFQSLIDGAGGGGNGGNGLGAAAVNTGSYYLNKPIFSYVGCFNDRRELRDVGDKDYTFITKFNKSIPTVELCVLLCAQDGYSIAGIQAL